MSFIREFTYFPFQANYIKKMNLGGGMVWALDLDDFRNRCGEGNYPLLNAIRSVLTRDTEPGPKRK